MLQVPVSVPDLDPKIISAFVALCGVVLGIIVRDVIIGLYKLSRRRAYELEDQDRAERETREAERREMERRRHDVVRVYADPLYRAVSSMKYRLLEILNRPERAAYLLPEAPETEFNAYKQISTLYRLSAVLGWIRAFRRDRSYLDPADTTPENSIDEAIGELEGALADGPHVENQRLDELIRIWASPENVREEDVKKDGLSVAVDNILRRHIAETEVTTALELSGDEKKALCLEVAECISDRLSIDIPSELVSAEVERASVYLGIKEAWIYRDWQSAIGDYVIQDVENASRRFDVIGYGEFEMRYMQAFEGGDDSPTRPWLNRLKAVFIGLDVSKKGMYDARRKQLRQTLQTCEKLEKALEQRIEQLRKSNPKLQA